MKNQPSKQVAIALSDAEKSTLALQVLSDAHIMARELRKDHLQSSVLKVFDIIITDVKTIEKVPEDLHHRVIYFWDDATPDTLYESVASKFYFTLPKGAKASLFEKVIRSSLNRTVGTASVDTQPVRGLVVPDIKYFSYNGFVADFEKGTYTYRDKAVYLTRGELDFVKKFAKNVPHSTGKERQLLYRMRKKFGSDFLSSRGGLYAVNSYE